MVKTLGNKNSFAIEYEFLDHGKFHNARSRVWCENDYLGNFEDSGPINGVFYYLNNMVNNRERFSTNEFKNKTKEKIYDTMIPYETREEYLKLPENIVDKLSAYDKFITGFNETYDQFICRSYIEENNICFLWKLNRNKTLHFHCIPFEIVKEVIEEFKEDLIKKGVIKE